MVRYIHSCILNMHTHTHTAPSHHPQNLSASILSSTSLRLTWQPPPPQYHHGEIREYNVRLMEASTERLIVMTSTSTELVVTDLLPYTLYECSVAAVTVEEGLFSAELVARTAEDGMYSSYVYHCYSIYLFCSYIYLCVISGLGHLLSL